MTKKEFEDLRARIEQRYRDDLAALDRIQSLLGVEAVVSMPEKTKRKLTRSEAMKASWLRRRKNNPSGVDDAPSKKQMKEFLANGSEN